MTLHRGKAAVSPRKVIIVRELFASAAIAASLPDKLPFVFSVEEVSGLLMATSAIPALGHLVTEPKAPDQSSRRTILSWKTKAL